MILNLCNLLTVSLGPYCEHFSYVLTTYSTLRLVSINTKVAGMSLVQTAFENPLIRAGVAYIASVLK